MGHRLTKIYTRTGDAGETGLGDGSRVPKDDLRVAALGDVDELNSCIGVLIAELPAASGEADLPGNMVHDALTAIQHDLFDLGGELSIPGHTSITEAKIQAQPNKPLMDFNGLCMAISHQIGCTGQPLSSRE